MDLEHRTKILENRKPFLLYHPHNLVQLVKREEINLISQIYENISLRSKNFGSVDRDNFVKFCPIQVSLSYFLTFDYRECGTTEYIALSKTSSSQAMKTSTFITF